MATLIQNTSSSVSCLKAVSLFWYIDLRNHTNFWTDLNIMMEESLMKIKNIELNDFKRFTHLTINNIPSTAKLVVLVGPNGSGKTSFMEALNHFYKYSGYSDIGDYHYLSKSGNLRNFDNNEWFQHASKMVNIEFYDAEFKNKVGTSNIKGHFYFRSAYRNEPTFQITSMHKQNDPTQSIRLSTLIQNDQTVSSNYQRLISNTIDGVFNHANDLKTVSTLRDELTGKIRRSINTVFEDLNFTSLGDPLANGNFYFSKGMVTNFSYQNLSAGEKSAFDLILDMVVQSQYYPDAIYCIDEPELHMHTKLQGKVLRELYCLIPGKSQLWVSTHSIGMLQEAEDLERENPGTVVFLDFGNRDFDEEQLITPSKIGKAVLDKFYELAFGDFAKLMLPKKIVFCEGSQSGKTRKDFDKTIFETIFGDSHPEAFFISAGSCSDIENIEEKNGEIINTLLKNTKIIKIVDRDDRTNYEISELNDKGIKVLKRRNLESYLFDDSVIKKLCEINNKPEQFENCIKAKKDAITNSISRKNAPDDYKSARGDIYNALKVNLSLTKCGSNADTFIRDILAPLITEDMKIYKELETEIFAE